MGRLLGTAMTSSDSSLAIGYSGTPPNPKGYRTFNFVEVVRHENGNFIEAPGRIHSIRVITPGTPNTWYQEDFGSNSNNIKEAFVRFNGQSSGTPIGHLAIGASQIEAATNALIRDLPITYTTGCVYVIVNNNIEHVCNVFDWIQVDQQ